MGNVDEGRFMVANGAVIENKNTGKILMIKRSNQADFDIGTWEGVTGRMKQAESSQDALKREIREETGIEDVEIIKPIRIESFFRGEKIPENEVVLIIYWVQTTTEEVVISPEHDDFKWVTPEEALVLTEHEGIREDIKAFLKEKSCTIL